MLESDLAWAPTHTLTNPFTEVVDHSAATSILAAGTGCHPCGTSGAGQTRRLEQLQAWMRGNPDDGAPSVIGQSSDEREQHRRSLWAYYDRRVAGRLPGLANAHAYWTGLGVTVEVEDIAAEAAQLERLLRELSAVRFVEVGAGPGTFTRYLSGSGIAIDQSRKALDVLRTEAPGVPVIQADATLLPVGSHAVDRCFSAHLYGLLLPGERESFLAEAHRVASEVVILDAGRPQGVSDEEWQERTLPGGDRYRVFRRHFDADALAAEVGGVVLFAGQFYVLVGTAVAS